MKLVAFAVKNYRSIQSTPRIELSALTVLVGPNNEGKSNLLGALVCALSLIQDRIAIPRRVAINRQSLYDYERDFPVALQSASTSSSTKFDLEFELDAQDMQAFKAATGSKLNGTLPIQLSVDRQGAVGFSVKKQGPAQRILTQNKVAVAQFIAERLSFQYIGAVRDEAQSRTLVENMVARALASLDTDPSYQAALKAIEAAERPVLAEVSKQLAASLKPFIGSLKKVTTQLSRDQRSRVMRRSTEILLDDGTLTSLAQKGDGVKSLVAIALAKASAELSAGTKNLILAIEEPEAHLHSGSIHTLRALLEDIAQTRQVIISTHEPALVRREDVAANILVKGNKASPASSLEEVRQVLGVQLTENLVSPDLVALVEGPGDARLIAAHIKAREPRLYKFIASGKLRVFPLNGAANLPHQLRFFQALVCSAVAFVDHDQEGNNALSRARSDGLLDLSAEFSALKPGLRESELEDLLIPSIYEPQLFAHLGITTLKPKSVGAGKAKWSDRLLAVLKDHGKPAQDQERLLREAKFKVNELALAAAGTCFIPNLTGPIDALTAALKNRLKVS